MNTVKNKNIYTRKKKIIRTSFAKKMKLILQITYFHIQCENLGLDTANVLLSGKEMLKGFSLKSLTEIYPNLNLLSPTLNSCFSPQTRFSSHPFVFKEMSNHKAPACPQIFQDNSPPPFLSDSGKSPLHPSPGLP